MEATHSWEGKSTPRSYSSEEKAVTVRPGRTLREELGTMNVRSE